MFIDCALALGKFRLQLRRTISEYVLSRELQGTFVVSDALRVALALIT